MTTVFFIIGGIGLALLVISLVFGEIVQLGEIDSDGPFSIGSLSAFLGAFGFGGAAGSVLLAGLGGVLGLIAALVAGVVAGVPAAWLAIRLTRAVMNMRTDATLTKNDVIGCTGVVITPVPAEGYGEVRIYLAGQPLKYNARADEPIELGSQVKVIGAPSDTSVVVEKISATADS